MTQPNGWLSIRQVAQRVGISTQLIRKWEQRYHLPEPRRLPNGYRVYSERDVTQLLKVRALMDRGYSVQNAVIAATSSEQAPEDERKARVHAAAEAEQTSPSTHRYIEELQVASSTNDKERLLFSLQRAYHELGLQAFATDILQPFLTQVGEWWRTGVWSEYQEHFASSTVLAFLQRVRSGLVEVAQGPLALCATVPYERHEISLQLLHIHALLSGWRVVYLGVSPAPGALERAIGQLQPALVLLSITTDWPLSQDADLLTALDTLAGQLPRTSFWLGCSQMLVTNQSLPPTSHMRQTANMRDILLALAQGSPYR